ncbi:MAG: translocation/assembly module TamB domain-containing protein, partial [Alistipes sp.]|nr:translocation/assembly module TamB domain-containing protein [Alistipes sp.]
MRKKILKTIFTVILSIVALMVVVAVLIYIPSVQRLIKDKVLSAVSSGTGMSVTVENFRMRFPAVLTLDDINIVGQQGDTILHSGSVGVRIAPLPLIGGKVKARGLHLADTYLNYADSAGSVHIAGRLQSLTIPLADVDLKRRDANIGGLDLSRGDIRMVLGEGSQDSSPSDSAFWSFRLTAANLSDIRFGMEGTGGRLEAYLGAGRIRDAGVSLREQSVRAASLRIDSSSYHYSPPRPSEKQPGTTAGPATDSGPWTIFVGSVELGDNIARYTAPERDFEAETRNGTGRFDPGDIAVEGLGLKADSVLNRGGEVRLRLSELSLIESSGLEITRASGSFAMDSASIRICDFTLDTPSSQIVAGLSSGSGALSGEGNSPVDGDISARIASGDLLLFLDAGGVESALRGKTLTLEGRFAGTLASLDIPRLYARVPGTAELTLEGTLASVGEPSRLGGNVTFRGATEDLSFVRSMIADSSLRARLDIPPGMNIYGRASFSPGIYSPDVTIRLDSGSLHLAGSVDTRSRNYSVDLAALDFPLFRFLPRDSLGIATLDLEATGSGFDPLDPATAAELALTIDRFDYYNYPYSEVTLRALLKSGVLSGQFHSDNIPLSADLDISGIIADSAYSANIRGSISNANLTAMGLSAEPLALAGILDAGATIYHDTAFVARVEVDTMRVHFGERMQTVAHAEIAARACPARAALSALAGDLDLDFTAKVPLDSISGRISAASRELSRQIDARSLDMEALQNALPPLKLDLEAGSDDILHGILLQEGYGFANLSVSASTLDDEPFRAAVVAKGFQRSGITLDTLNLWLRRNDQRLEYALRLRNRPGNIDQMAMVRARGYLGENRAEISILQRNRRDSIGFRFGLEAALLDSVVTVTLTPADPVFGYRRWSVNEGNYFTYDFDRELYADMRIDGDGEHIHIVSAPFEGFERGAVRVDIAGLDIATGLELIPDPPRLGGVLSTDLLFGMTGDMFAAGGMVEIDSARWGGRRIGDIDLTADFRADSTSGDLKNAVLTVDGSQVLTAGGNLGKGATDLQASLTSFPLTALDPFLPEDALQLDGQADGQISLSTRDSELDLNGTLSLAGAGLTVPVTGTRYSFPSEYIAFEHSRINFDRYAITDPGGQPLVIDGTLDISDLSNIDADLSVNARNFEAVNSQRSGESAVYGRALTDIDITAHGRLDALEVRGDISVLSGTDVTYTLPDNDLEIEDRTQDIVTFISFADTAAVFTLDSAALLRVWGMDMLVNVDIRDNVQATINLSADGNNRAELIGDGTLTFTMNNQGDSRFTGRYNLSGGTVVYNPPVISAKTFTVNDGSYVEWTGDIADPTFNVTATESLRTTVTSDDGTSGNVTFNVTVSIRNTLENLELLFDISAPGDITIQNQLQTLSADQRSQQALALLIYNTYTGPGTTAKVDVNNPLNSFVEKQLNQWARNSLPGVDFSFGVTSVDDSATGGGQHTD